MSDVDNVVNSVLLRLVVIFDFLVAYLVGLESGIRELMNERGIAPPFQTAILIVFAVIVAVLAVRLLAGIFRLVIVLLAVLVTAHLVLPLIQ
jgi:flagellin-like protein